MGKTGAAFSTLLLALTLSAWAQNSGSSMDMPHGNGSMNDMPGMNHDMPGMNEPGSEHAMESMSSRHMDMGAHMKMTALRKPEPGDQQKADQVVAAARQVAGKYKDYKVALADGFVIFHPELPQKQYHFTNRKNAFRAIFTFDPQHPTSLLYEKQGTGYKLVGVMYTAPRNFTEDDLNARIPLSVAQWHAHVNFCVPPRGKRAGMFGPNPQFGFRGSISTKAECDEAGGIFLPQVFGWMVHVYPFEQKQEDIWSVERQGHSHMD